jgi:hypothetical protein
VTIDAGVFVTLARRDIVVGLPGRRPGRQCVVQVGSGRTIPVVKEALVELTLGQRALKIWVFVADVTDEFILGLDILRAYDASVDVGRHVLRMGQEKVPVREAPTASVLSRSRPTESHSNRRPVCWKCGGIGHPRKECPRRPAKEVVDKRNSRRDCATGERCYASRQTAESTPLLDEKQWLDRHISDLGEETEDLRAPTAELEAALEGRAGCQLRVTCRTVRAVAAAPPDGRDRAALRREELASDGAKAHQNRLINSARSSECDHVWTYSPARNGGKSPKHHSDQGRGLPGPAAP